MKNFFPEKFTNRSFATAFKTFILCFVILLPAFALIHPAAADTFRFRYSNAEFSTVHFYEVIPVAAGGYLAVGKAYDISENDTEYDAVIVRINKNGQALWSRYFTFGIRYADLLYSVVETSDGSFIATGHTRLAGSDHLGNPASNNAILIVKVNGSGNILWQKLIQNEDIASASGFRIKSTNDGHFIIAGQAVIHDWDANSQEDGGLLCKIDASGNVIFSNSYYGGWLKSWRWCFNDVVQDSEGNYYGVGWAQVAPYSEGIGSQGMLLAKINPAGNMIWAQKTDYALGGEAQIKGDSGHRILLSGGSLYVAGATDAATLSSFSISGTHNWTKQYDCGNNYQAGVTDFIDSNDGNFLVAMTGNCGNLSKISPQGNVLWSKATHQNNKDYRSLSLSNNSLVAGGYSIYHNSSGTDGIIDKFDTSGSTCENINDLTFTITDLEMVSNAVPFYVKSRPAAVSDMPSAWGPVLSAEVVCKSDSDDDGDDNTDDDDGDNQDDQKEDDDEDSSSGCFIKSM